MLGRLLARLPVAAIMLLLWIALSGGEGWLFAIFAIALSLLTVSTLLTPVSHRLSLPGTVRFLGYFLFRSLAGGLDVAWRALHPALPLDIRFVEHRFTTSDEAVRTVIIGTLSLMPGTLSVGVTGDTLRVHSIAGDVRHELQALETSASRVFRATRSFQGA